MSAKLDLPVFQEPLPLPRTLTPDEYYAFVMRNRRMGLGRSREGQTQADDVKVPFRIVDGPRLRGR